MPSAKVPTAARPSNTGYFSQSSSRDRYATAKRDRLKIPLRGSLTVKEIYQDDALLIQRFQSGEHSAFDALIQKHQARAYQYAYRLARDAEEASDVVAEAFVRVYKALCNFKGESAFTTWLYRILTNCYLD